VQVVTSRQVRTLQRSKQPARICIATTVMRPAMMALVVAMAWMMLPAMPCEPSAELTCAAE